MRSLNRHPLAVFGTLLSFWYLPELTFCQTGSSNNAPFGYVDQVSNDNGGNPVVQNGYLVVRGWAADLEDGSITNVVISIDGNIIGNAWTGFPRPDVSS